MYFDFVDCLVTFGLLLRGRECTLYHPAIHLLAQYSRRCATAVNRRKTANFSQAVAPCFRLVLSPFLSDCLRALSPQSVLFLTTGAKLHGCAARRERGQSCSPHLPRVHFGVLVIRLSEKSGKYRWCTWFVRYMCTTVLRCRIDRCDTACCTYAKLSFFHDAIAGMAVVGNAHAATAAGRPAQSLSNCNFWWNLPSQKYIFHVSYFHWKVLGGSMPPKSFHERLPPTWVVQKNKEWS